MADSTELKLPSLQKLQSPEQLELLDVVDSLRGCGLSEIVNLPQLIVCGDQSSGKSSVLEAISGIPFPRQDVLCTRFATEVILRRATKDEITVSIVPGENTSSKQETLKQFRRDLKTNGDFESLFESARDAMGLSAAGKSFSNDVLRVEVSGPTQPQLTLVDLPGLIHTETKSQSASDVKLVHSLVMGYLKNPRSIILAVVSAKNDIGNQIILRKAREVDPQGLRTLGIITKPDLLSKGSRSEEAFLALARNEDVKFSLGWHVIKNLDFAIQPVQNDTRDQKEIEFFQESSFKSLPIHIVGISFLRSRLSKLLFLQIRTELPRLVDDIQIQILAAKRVQDKFGPDREGIEDQRRFLISLSQTFQTICRDAIRGDYEHNFFQDDANPERRLCANIMNMHFDFAKNLRKSGAYWLIEEGDIDDYRYRTRDEAIKEACLLVKRSRGRELPGLPNPLLVGELFREYSRPWGGLARQHIKNVWEATNRFLDLLLRHLADADTCENVFRYWLHSIMEEKLNLSFGKLTELLDVHKDYPMTTNSSFINKRKSSGIEPTMNRNPNVDMDMVAAEEALQNMNAYYDVAMNLFTDNVPALAIQAPIVREIPNIFCPTAVFSMSAEMVQKIAGETEEKVEERRLMIRRLSILENGALICKRYAKRSKAFVGPSAEDTKTAELSSAARQASGKTSLAGFSILSSKKLPSEGVYQNPFAHLSVQNPFPSMGNLKTGVQSNDVTSSADEKAVEGFLGSKPSETASAFSFGKTYTSKSVSEPLGSNSTKDSGNGLGVNNVKTSGADSSTTRSFFGASASNSTNTPSLFSTRLATTPGAGLFGSSSTSKPTTPTPSGFPSVAKNVNSLNFPTDLEPTKYIPSHLSRIIFEPFVAPEVRTVNPIQYDVFQHICFMEELRKFSPEELRYSHY